MPDSSFFSDLEMHFSILALYNVTTRCLQATRFRFRNTDATSPTSMSNPSCANITVPNITPIIFFEVRSVTNKFFAFLTSLFPHYTALFSCRTLLWHHVRGTVFLRRNSLLIFGIDEDFPSLPFRQDHYMNCSYLSLSGCCFPAQRCVSSLFWN